MIVGCIWGVLGDENVPMQVDMEDVILNQRLTIDIAEFDADMEKSASCYPEEDKPF